MKMVDVYYRLVKAGSRTMEQVPENLRADVQAKMNAAAAENPEQPAE
jgi:hypothetical protein